MNTTLYRNQLVCMEMNTFVSKKNYTVYNELLEVGLLARLITNQFDLKLTVEYQRTFTHLLTKNIVCKTTQHLQHNINKTQYKLNKLQLTP